jgi:hypothetical protein
MPKRRLVIELYDHTTVDEVADIVQSLNGIGLHDVKYETVDTGAAVALQQRLYDDYHVTVCI